MAPSMVVLLNTPLILLPMRLIPKDSPLFDVLLQKGRPVWQSVIGENTQNGADARGFSKKTKNKKGACSLKGVAKRRGVRTGTGRSRVKERAQLRQIRAGRVMGWRKQSGQTVTEKPSHILPLFKEQTANTAHTQRWGFTLCGAKSTRDHVVCAAAPLTDMTKTGGALA